MIAAWLADGVDLMLHKMFDARMMLESIRDNLPLSNDQVFRKFKFHRGESIPNHR